MNSHEQMEARLQLPRSFSSLPTLTEFLRGAARSFGLDEESEYGVQLVAEELFTNMVKYGAEGGPNVTVCVACSDGRVRMVFEDPGTHPFDPTTAKPRDLDLPTEKRRPGGLGVHLVRTYMDEFTYEHRGGTGYTTVSRKVRTPRA